MATGFSLKDELFNAGKVGWLADQFGGAIDRTRFEAAVMARLPELELKERIDWIAECLISELPEDFEAAADVIEAHLPPALDDAKTDDDFGDFIIAPLGEVVVKRGASHFDRSMGLLYALTQRFSMEFAVRHFLKADAERGFDYLERWAGDANYHVRRLVSEGTRPKLPWGIGLMLDQDRRLDLLDRLHGDQTRYVTRSVANHLNDISKSDPDAVVTRLSQWEGAGVQGPKELAWMQSHALRTLIKAGHKGALAAEGYHTEPKVELVSLRATPEVKMGEVLSFEAQLSGQADEGLLVDYVIEFLKANGSQAPKVFKLKKLWIQEGQDVTLSKSRRLLKDATTYRLYPGTHRLKLQVNGQILGEVGFEVLT